MGLHDQDLRALAEQVGRAARDVAAELGRGYSRRRRALEALAAARRAEVYAARLVGDAVTHARAAGASWQQVADQLEVPRQTAHRRYRAPQVPPRDRPG